MSSAHLAPVGYQIFINPNTGLALASGSVYTYQAGTTTPQAAYTDETAATPTSNPITLDLNGGATFWLKNGLGYKIVVEDASANVIYTRDNVYNIEPSSIGDAQITPGGITPASLNLATLTSAELPNDVIQTANITPGNVTGGTGGSLAPSTIEASNIDPTIDLTQSLQKMIEVVYKRTYDFSGMRLEAVPQIPWSSPVQLSNPGTLPPAAGTCLAWSPDGNFLAVGSGTTPYVDIYERNGQTFTYLGTPGTLPAGSVNDVKWSPNGDFLVCAHATTPFITIYQRTGNTFTKLSNPVTLPGATTIKIGWSPNGELMIAAPNNVSFPPLLYQVSGTTFTSLGSLGLSRGPADFVFTGDGQYLVEPGGTTQFNIESVTSTVLNSVTNSGTLAGLSCLDFTHDSGFIAAGIGNNSPYITLWTFTGGTLAQLSNPTTLPTSAVNACAWSLNGQYLALALASSPYIMVYQRSGTTFTALTAPVALPAGAGAGIAWSPTGQFLAIAVGSSPYVNIYQTASSLPADGILWARNLVNV